MEPLWKTVCRSTEKLIDVPGSQPKQKILEDVKKCRAANNPDAEERLQGILAAVILRSKAQDAHLNEVDDNDLYSRVCSSAKDQEARIEQLAFAIEGLADDLIISSKLSQIKQQLAEHTNKETCPVPKQLEGMEGVSVAKRREKLLELFRKNASATIMNNNVFKLAQKIVPDQDRLLSQTEARIKSMGPKFEQLVKQIEAALSKDRPIGKGGIAAALATQGVQIPEDLQNGLQKYIFYLECMQIDNERHAENAKKRLSDYVHFVKADEAWQKGGAWPNYSVPFQPWAKRRPVPPKDVSDVEKVIQSRKGELDQIKLAIELCINYWEDAYNFCCNLQSRPMLKEIGERMEKELWLAEQKSALIMGSDEPINSIRLPQPKEVQAARG